MIDSHIHIDAPIYQKDEGLGEILRAAAAAGVERLVAPSLHLDSYSTLAALARLHPEIHPAAGIHPHEVTEERVSQLLVSLPRVLAEMPTPIIGETGLEGHYDFSDPELQMRSLQVHLDAAEEHLAPVILHCRQAEEELYAELSKRCLPAGGVVHCFTGSWDWAQRFLDLGFHIGITGIVTFKRADTVAEVAAKVPLDRLLVETDGPFLAPVPHRGRTNRPEYIPLIVGRIAELRGVSPSVVAKSTASNCIELFRLPELRT